MNHARLLAVMMLPFLLACHSPEPTISPMSTAVATLPPTPTGTANGTSLPTAAAPPRPTPIPTAAAQGETLQIPPTDSHLRYEGRFDFQDPERPAFDWSGSSIEALFTGSTLTILLQDGSNHYNVTIDGRTSVLQTVPGQISYPVAVDLPPGEHYLRLSKRTEAYVGAGVFVGLVVDAGQELLDLPALPDRRLEFVGDSITAGYGIEGDSPECYFTPATQNAALTFAAQTAESLHARYSLLALSGLGVVRNLRDNDTASPVTAISYIDRALAMNPVAKASPLDTAPDAVIINLGTNDFSSLPFPDDDSFVAAYRQLLHELRARYPAAHLVALAGPLMQGRAHQLIATAVELQAAEGDERTHFVSLEDTLVRTAVDFGCDWHPNTAGHQKMAAQLTPALAHILDW